MIKRILVPAATLGAIAAIAVLGASPSFALTAKECSVKYNAAKSAGTLNGMSWNEYRKQECGSGAAAADDKPVVKPSTGTAAATTTAPSGAVFPKAIDPKYAGNLRARRACTLVSISTTPIRRQTAMVD